MAASALAKLLPHACSVHLVESAEIGIVGVGEATLPHLRAFIQTLGLDETAFMAATHATFKLGIDFHDFGRIGEHYLHPFGGFGQPLQGVAFFQYWLRMRASRGDNLFAYSPCNVMAAANRFARPSMDRASPFANISYAYQFDATLFGPYLRTHAQSLGAKRTEGKIVSVQRDPLNGDIASLTMADGCRIEGDLFIDCSGFRSLLLGEALGETWKTGRAGSRAIGPLLFLVHLPQNRSNPIPARPPCRAAGAGESRFNTALVTVTFILARMCPTTRRLRLCLVRSRAHLLPIRVHFASKPDAAAIAGLATSSQSDSHQAFSNRWSRQASILPKRRLWN